MHLSTNIFADNNMVNRVVDQIIEFFSKKADRTDPFDPFVLAWDSAEHSFRATNLFIAHRTHINKFNSVTPATPGSDLLLEQRAILRRVCRESVYGAVEFQTILDAAPAIAEGVNDAFDWSGEVPAALKEQAS